MNRPEIHKVDHHYTGVVLVTETGKIIGQQRDDKAGIDNPGRVGTFGGTVEAGEQPQYAAWRELTQEETNLKLDEQALHPFYEDVEWRELTKEWEARHFYYANIMDADLNTLEVYEGQGWAVINSSQDPNLIDLWRPVIKKLEKTLNLVK